MEELIHKFTILYKELESLVTKNREELEKNTKYRIQLDNQSINLQRQEELLKEREGNVLPSETIIKKEHLVDQKLAEAKKLERDTVSKHESKAAEVIAWKEEVEEEKRKIEQLYNQLNKERKAFEEERRNYKMKIIQSIEKG